MRRSLVILLALVVAPACSDRTVEEPRESHRHLAEAWCADWCPWWVVCETVLEWSVDECLASCEGDEWWDWTDECGDIRWEYNECIAAQTCEDARDAPDLPGTDDPCQSYLDELVIKECRYDRPHGE